MKVPDSGMPEETYWNSLFNVPLIVEWLNLKEIHGPIVEIGCGYGTFTTPIAQAAGENVFALDIEKSMIEAAHLNARQAGLTNIGFIQRDVVQDGTGLGKGIAGLVLLFNILHFDGKRSLLEEAARILKTGGKAAIIHWRKDIATPRGPIIKLRPDEKSILDAADGLGFLYDGNSTILEPFHWGMQLMRASE